MDNATRTEVVMDAYRKAYDLIGLDQRLIDCGLGKITLPVIGWGTPEWYGFPPALIPIWSTGSRPAYLGAWKHWFVDRPVSYVKMYVASGRQVIEVARTPDQLLTVVMMMAIANDDGIEQPLVEFAGKVKMAERLEDIDAVSLETGDDAKGFTKLQWFQTMTPLSSIETVVKYDGGFPVVVDGHCQGQSCSFELVNRVQDASMPNWMVNVEKRQEMFDSRLASKQYDEAWLILNSTGWAIDDAKAALWKLVDASGDSQLGVIAEAWCDVAEAESGSY